MDERTEGHGTDRPPRVTQDPPARPRGRVQPAAALLAASAAQTAAYTISAAVMAGRFARRRLLGRPPAYSAYSATGSVVCGAPSGPGERPAPRISVVLPAYNAVRDGRGYFEEALESVAAQSYAPLELIVVDDGSSDGSGEAAAAFAAAHPELSVTLLRQENGGQSSARNLGASRAAGDWLAFLDQDDRWKKHRLEVVAPLLGGSVDLVYTDADTIDAEGSTRERAIHQRLGLGGGHPLRDPAAALARDVFVMPGVTTIRTSFFRSLGGFDPMLSGYEDDDLFVRAVHRGCIAYVPESTLEWRTDHGANSSGTGRMVDSRVHYWRKLVRDFAGNGADARLTRRITTRFFLECLRQATMCLDAGDPLAAANVAAADLMCAGLAPVDRLAYSRTRWAWRRDDRTAYLTRWWLLNGLERTAGSAWDS